MKQDIFSKQNCYKEYSDIKSIHLYGNCNDCLAPLISIIMPVFKRPDTFIESLRSALQQNFSRPYEIVVVDNYDGEGESPNLEVVKRTGASNIMYYHNDKNLGMYGNWNRGIELARAEFITFCHDDDILLPNCLSRLMELQKVCGKKCILSKFNRIDENGEYLSLYDYPHIKMGLLKEKDHYEYTLYNQFICSMGFGVGCLFCRSCMLELGGYNKAFYPSADYALHAAYTYFYGCVINNIPTFNYRVAINESYTAYVRFAEVDKHFRECMISKIHLSKWCLKMYVNAKYRKSVIDFAVLWGKKDPSILKNNRKLDNLIVKIASFPNRYKSLGLFADKSRFNWYEI